MKKEQKNVASAHGCESEGRIGPCGRSLANQGSRSSHTQSRHQNRIESYMTRRASKTRPLLLQSKKSGLAREQRHVLARRRRNKDAPCWGGPMPETQRDRAPTVRPKAAKTLVYTTNQHYNFLVSARSAAIDVRLQGRRRRSGLGLAGLLSITRRLTL